MTYTINKTDGNELTKIPDGTLDTTATALTLIGRNSVGFGEAFNENFVKLLENFASTTAPENAIKGQIWFDTRTNRLNVFDGNIFRASGGPQVSPRAPDPLTTGDLWINNETNQMYMYDGTDLILVGPIYTAQQGITGFKVDTVLDIDGVSHSICQLFVKSALLGIFSSTAFFPKLPIPGYGTVDKPVKVGFNASTLSNLKFDVTVTRSESILLEDGLTSKTASELVFNNEENTFTERVFIQNNEGLDIGTASQSRQYISSNDLIIENQIENKSIQLKVKSGSTTVSGITIAGNGQRVGIFNETPTSTLDIAGDLKVSGDIFVGGVTTTLNTSVLEVEDKNITLGNTSFPTNLTAAGGGITLKGATDKTILYNNVSNSWDLSENLKLASGKTFSINNDQIIAPNGLGQYTLGTTVVTSSLVSVGNLISLQMAGSGTSGLNLQDGTISLATGNIGFNPVAGAVTLNDKRIIDVADPVGLQDATNKQYVDDAVFARGIAFSMDITGLEVAPGVDDNDAIAAILDNIAPFYSPTGTLEEQQGIAINGTILRLHCTKTSATSTDLDYSPNVGDEFSTVDISSALGQPPGTTAAVTDIVTGQVIEAPALTVSVTRQNKKFTMTNGNWAFNEDIA
jgi:hypothetical protein